MTDGRATHKRHAKMGPGGMRCTCCGPAPGKCRKQAKRSWKRRERGAWRREARAEIGRGE